MCLICVLGFWCLVYICCLGSLMFIVGSIVGFVLLVVVGFSVGVVVMCCLLRFVCAL